MDLKVPYKNVATREEAYKAACEQITPEYIAKWNIKADITYDEPTTTISATGKGFTLTIVFAQSEAQVNCDLSLMLRPFKKKVTEAVENKLQKHI